MGKVYNFVITGGPCAGKTTALSKLEQILTQKGFKVIIIPETATEAKLAGINPKEIPIADFERLIIHRSINKENTVRRIANYYKKDVVILHDRGLLDCKAYMPYRDFVRQLALKELTEIEARDRYDAVFHLVSAAIGKEDFYTTENNLAREESIEEAKLLDEKTRNAWVGHPHLRVIDNSMSFEKKMDALIEEVISALGIPVPIETERKFLIKIPSVEDINKHKCVKSNIVQTYLLSLDSSLERRVRQRGINGDYSFYYTEKKKISDSERYEKERMITKDEYLEYLVEGIASLSKDRYCFLYQNQYFELDIYPNWKDEAILEIELTSKEQKIILPDWIEVIKEVTDDENYSNANIAKKGQSS